MAAQRKYDDETRERAVRMYQDRRRESPGESAVGRPAGGSASCWTSNRRRCAGGSSAAEIDAGQRPGVPSATEARIKELERENAELRRANEILKTASAFFAQAELDRRLR